MDWAIASGWIVAAGVGIAWAFTALRLGGYKADLEESEAERKALEEKFRKAAIGHADREDRLLEQVDDLGEDLRNARDELGACLAVVPGRAAGYLDSATERAARILSDLKERPPGVPDSRNAP